MGKEEWGVSARCLRPLQLLPPHFVAWRHLEEMQMSRRKERRLRHHANSSTNTAATKGSSVGAVK